MTDASYTQVTGKLDLIDRREILRTWQNVCIGISCSQCQFYNDDVMSGDCLLERWVHSLPSAEPEITRCKDCRWWDKSEDSPFGYCMAMKHGYMSANWEIGIYRRYKGDWYCADAERRTDE